MKNLKYILILLTVVWFYGCETSGSSADEDATGPAKLSLIETPATTGSGEPNLFTDPEGNVYLSWVENTEKERVLKFCWRHQYQAFQQYKACTMWPIDSEIPASP